jgi:tetratricopeptide (TPR) repeat protein
VAGTGPGGSFAAGSRGVAGTGPGGSFAAGSRGAAAVGPGGAYAGRAYGAAGYGPGGWHGGAYGAYHAGWVNGYWHGNYAGWGYGWGGYGLGLATGLAAWGLGSALYSGYGGGYGWGYADYANPYYDQSYAAVSQPFYDYSQPIDTTAAAPAEDVATPALSTFDQARDAFKNGDFANALALTEQSLKTMPNDPAIHEFRGIVLFALKRYEEAASEFYTVLSVGPGWDWTTLISLYPSVDVYTDQLRALESYAQANRSSAAARFLLANLYLTSGQTDAAVAELNQVVQLQPKDKVSAFLLASISKAQSPDTAQAPGAAPVPSQQPPAGAKIEGTWVAQPASGTTITLSATTDGKFSWKVTSKGRTNEIKGTSSFENGVLSLAPGEDRPPMVGNVKWQDANQFTFQAMGGGPADPGLTFKRSA